MDGDLFSKSYIELKISMVYDRYLLGIPVTVTGHGCPARPGRDRIPDGPWHPGPSDGRGDESARRRRTDSRPGGPTRGPADTQQAAVTVRAGPGRLVAGVTGRPGPVRQAVRPWARRPEPESASSWLARRPASLGEAGPSGSKKA